MKRGFGSELNRPLFSILNPELTYTVSKYQTACGIVDIMMHTLERYITQPGDVLPTDEISEAILRSVIKAGKTAIDYPEDYEARATLMWCGSLSHNNLTGLGRDYFMVSHQIEHEISGMFENVAHGAGLAVVYPAYCKYMYKYNLERFARLARNVWGVNQSDDAKAALLGIEAAENFFKSIGMPTTLSELDIHSDSFEEMAIKCTNFGKRTLPGHVELGKDEIVSIFKLAK
jgi:alcohol dehydrogenase YqhD (iron-dependent ADH family)